MIMYMCPVSMSRHNKSIFAFRKAQRQFITDPVGILRCDLSRFEGLPYLICDHIVILFPAGDLQILPFGVPMAIMRPC